MRDRTLPDQRVRVIAACPSCEGKGRVYRQYTRGGVPYDENGLGLGWYWMACPRCDGAGRLVPMAEVERILSRAASDEERQA